MERGRGGWRGGKGVGGSVSWSYSWPLVEGRSILTMLSCSLLLGKKGTLLFKSYFITQNKSQASSNHGYRKLNCHVPEELVNRACGNRPHDQVVIESPVGNHWEELSIEESQCVTVQYGLGHDPVTQF